MQCETIARFGGVSLQTLVVTNNIIKFSDAITGRFISRPYLDKKDKKNRHWQKPYSPAPAG